MRKYKTLTLYITSFILPLIILSAIALSLGLTPFGAKNLMVSDLGAQYSAFFAYFKDLMQGQANPFYSFSIGLGDDTFALTAYYLLSPFNFLFTLGRTANLDNLISIVIALKISCIAPSLLFYLHKTYRKIEPSQLFFALAFSLSGFVAAYFTNLMWLDALILLPLVLVALQRLFEKGRGLPYMLLLFLAIVTNYYQGYMICIFVVIYWFYWSLKQTDFTTFKDYWRKTKARFWAFTRYSVFAGLLSSFILIPALQGMTETVKTKANPMIFLPTLRFWTDIFQQLGLSNNSFLTRLSQLPNIYPGILMVLLATLYFQLSFSKKDKLLSAFMLLALFASFLFQTFNTIWHMFQLAAGFPYRNSYMMSFMLILLAYETWQKRQEITLRMVVRSVSGLGILMLIGYLTSFKYAVSWQLFSISILFFVLFGILLTLKQRKIFAILLFSIFTVELGINFYHSMSPITFGNTATFSKEYKTVFKLSENMRDYNKDSLLRMDSDLHWTTNQGYNQPMTDSYFGLSSYSSTMDNQLRLTQTALGMYSRNVRRISNIGLNNFTAYLLDVNARISENLTTDSKVLKSLNKNNVQQINPEKSSIGYFLPSLAKVKFSKTSAAASVYDNQTAIARAIMSDSKFSLFNAQSLTKNPDEPKTWTLTTTDSGELFLRLSYSKKHTAVSVLVNNVSYHILPSTLIYIGSYQAGEKLTIKTIGLTQKNFPAKSVQILKQDAESQLIEKMNAGKVDLSYNYRRNTLDGSVNSTGKMPLFLSIPYDEDWHVTVDGKTAKFGKTLNDNFSSLKLSAGSHKLHIYYLPNLFFVSCGLSLISAVIFIFWEILFRRKHRKS